MTFDSGKQIHPIESRLFEQRRQLAERVLFQVQSAGYLVEVFRNVVWTRQSVRCNTNVSATRRKDLAHIGELFPGVIRMYMLHELITESERDGPVRYGNVCSVGYDQVKIDWQSSLRQNFSRYVQSISSSDSRCNRDCELAVSSAEFQKRSIRPKKFRKQSQFLVHHTDKRLWGGSSRQLRMRRNAAKELIVHHGVQGSPKILRGSPKTLGEFFLYFVVELQLLRGPRRHCGDCPVIAILRPIESLFGPNGYKDD